MIEGKDQAATTETMITGDMIPMVLLHPPPMARDLGAQVPTRDREENIDPAAGNMIEDINSHGIIIKLASAQVYSNLACCFSDETYILWS